MFLASLQALQVQQAPFPSYFNLVILLLLGAGALGWLVASVLGFARAGAHGAAVRWFALASVCMLIFHLHVVVVGIAISQGAGGSAFALAAFLLLFVFLAAVCAVIGFTRLNKE